MPDPAPSTPHRLVVGTAELSKLPSSVPVVVVPDHVLPTTAGPVPVRIQHEAHDVRAWAWAERAWGGSETVSAPDRESDQTPTFWLSRLALERIGTDTAGAPVSLAIPGSETLTPVLPLVHDLPENGEVQVASGSIGPGSRVMVRNGVATWVTVVPRDHVRPGTARISNHLRAITKPTPSAPPAPDMQFFQPLTDGPERLKRRHTVASICASVRSVSEYCLQWFFLAPEQPMRVASAHPDDEHQHIVTLHDVALSRLGVRSGDDVILRWGTTEVEVPAVTDHAPAASGTVGERSDPTKPLVARDMPSHLAVRVPTALRHMMDLPAASVVTVRRSTRSVLARNLNNLVIPVASLALAGAALNDPNWALLTCGAVVTAVLGLSRLRMGDRRAVRLKE